MIFCCWTKCISLVIFYGHIALLYAHKMYLKLMATNYIRKLCLVQLFMEMMNILSHSASPFDPSLPHSHGRETLPMRVLQQVFLCEGESLSPPENSHKGASLQMRSMREGVRAQWQTPPTHADPHGRATP